MRKIILASRSPRRSLLLEWAAVPFEVITEDTEENYPNNLSPEEVAIHIAFNKATAVKNKIEVVNDQALSALPVLAADTIVVLDNIIIGKPDSREHAISILSKLSGKTHIVITGICILNGEKVISFSEKTQVEFHHLSQEQIEFYVDNYKPYDKAGAYAIQEWIGVVGIKSVNGDFYNVMGLPVSRVVQEVNLLEN